jgi:hypothetical protein
MREIRHFGVLGALLLIGSMLRFSGLTRGEAALDLPGQRASSGATAFHHFHPDEETVIRAALSWDFDLVHPPFTAYGVLPVCLLRSALAVAGLFGWSGTSLDDPESARRIYYLARGLAALCSCGVLCLVWAMGCRYFSHPVAGVGLALTAFAPGAIQQAHFYIVDGLFVLLSTAAVYVSLGALAQKDWRRYALAGALIGATAAVRLNGLLLGGVLLAGCLASRGEEGSGWKVWGRRLGRPGLWLAGVVALLVLLAIEPFLLFMPGMLGQANENGDFSHALSIARGRLLQPWTLADAHTLPYLDHWRLWALIAGWPLSFLFLAALVYVLWQRQRASALMALWCGLHFLLIGQFQTRAVRYLVPMLPFLALFAGALIAEAWQAPWPWLRRVGKVVAVLVVTHLVVKGVAFARLYTVEDSRLQASRWVAQHVPRGSPVGVEGGAFSMRGLVSEQGYQQIGLDVMRLFYTTPYLSCRAQLYYLQQWLQRMDYLVVIDVNRHAQFTAVPERFPILAGLYQRLAAGELGFDQIQRFKVYPEVLGIEFQDDSAEPSFLGYDHPAVWVFKSRGKEAVDSAFIQWDSRLKDEPCCPDERLSRVVEALQVSDWPRAREQLQALTTLFPELALAHRLLGEVCGALGQADSAAAAVQRYLPENQEPAVALNGGTRCFIPAHAALSFARLGLVDLALQVLREGAKGQLGFAPESAEVMSASYLEVAGEFARMGAEAEAGIVTDLSTQLSGAASASD